jgi:hypothetical protein
VALLLADECREDIKKGIVSTWETDPIQIELFITYLAERQHDPVIGELRKAIEKVWNPCNS